MGLESTHCIQENMSNPVEVSYYLRIFSLGFQELGYTNSIISVSSKTSQEL